MRNHDSTKKRKIRNQEESNALIQRNVRSSNLNLLTTNKRDTQFEINMMGNMTDCNFYIPDATGENTGLAFRVAYHKAIYNEDNKTLCAYVGSMLCSVVPGFKNSVEAALNGTGIRPHFISLPSQAHKNNILISNVPKLDRSTILVVFGYCILLLFKVDHNEFFNLYRMYSMRQRPILNMIEEMRAKVGCSPSNYLSLPFKEEKEDAIRTMIGTLDLRTSVINFLMKNFDHSDSQICSLCHYLSYTLSWSGDMRVFTVMNKWLLKTESPVLSGSRVELEVDNLEETIKAIASHTYPQYFSHLCLASQLFHLDVSRFPNLFLVALVMEQGWDDYEIERDCSDIPGSNYKTVSELLKIHRTGMAKNRVSTRCMPTIPGI